MKTVGWSIVLFLVFAFLTIDVAWSCELELPPLQPMPTIIGGV